MHFINEQSNDLCQIYKGAFFTFCAHHMSFFLSARRSAAARCELMGGRRTTCRSLPTTTSLLAPAFLEGARAPPVSRSAPVAEVLAGRRHGNLPRGRAATRRQRNGGRGCFSPPERPFVPGTCFSREGQGSAAGLAYVPPALAVVCGSAARGLSLSLLDQHLGAAPKRLSFLFL